MHSNRAAVAFYMETDNKGYVQ